MIQPELNAPSTEGAALSAQRCPLTEKEVKETAHRDFYDEHRDRKGRVLLCLEEGSAVGRSDEAYDELAEAWFLMGESHLASRALDHVSAATVMLARRASFAERSGLPQEADCLMEAFARARDGIERDIGAVAMVNAFLRLDDLRRANQILSRMADPHQRDAALTAIVEHLLRGNGPVAAKDLNAARTAARKVANPCRRRRLFAAILRKSRSNDDLAAVNAFVTSDMHARSDADRLDIIAFRALIDEIDVARILADAMDGLPAICRARFIIARITRDVDDEKRSLDMAYVVVRQPGTYWPLRVAGQRSLVTQLLEFGRIADALEVANEITESRLDRVKALLEIHGHDEQHCYIESAGECANGILDPIDRLTAWNLIHSRYRYSAFYRAAA